MEFDETFPSWKNKFYDDQPMGRTKFLLKTVPGGNTEYSSSFQITPYNNIQQTNEGKDCYDLSTGLVDIFTGTKDIELRTFIWEVRSYYLIWPFLRYKVSLV